MAFDKNIQRFKMRSNLNDQSIWSLALLVYLNSRYKLSKWIKIFCNIQVNYFNQNYPCLVLYEYNIKVVYYWFLNSFIKAIFTVYNYKGTNFFMCCNSYIFTAHEENCSFPRTNYFIQLKFTFQMVSGFKRSNSFYSIDQIFYLSLFWNKTDCKWIVYFLKFRVELR